MIEKKAKSSIIKIRRQADTDTEALSKMRKCHAESESEISKPSQNLFHKAEVLSQLSKSRRQAKAERQFWQGNGRNGQFAEISKRISVPSGLRLVV